MRDCEPTITGSRHVTVLLLLMSLLGGCAAAAKEETFGPGITGLDHLPEHLSIQDFWVDGHAGHQAGKGGSKVCCAKLPVRWRPDLTVTVRWGVTNWPAKVYSMHEQVPVEKYEEPGSMHVHFLPDNSVRVIVSSVRAWTYAWDLDSHAKIYPGPSYATVLNKEPWKVYKLDRGPDRPPFRQVLDATKVSYVATATRTDLGRTE